MGAPGAMLVVGLASVGVKSTFRDGLLLISSKYGFMFWSNMISMPIIWNNLPGRNGKWHLQWYWIYGL